MNRIFVSEDFVSQLRKAQEVEQVRNELHSAVRRLADDPTSNSFAVPFQEYEDLRMASVGEYVILLKFDPEKSEVYLLSILQKSENTDPAAPLPSRS
jgi:mRNA-degrading endonuclease RelE of RelBE toxin-antitoxin system